MAAEVKRVLRAAIERLQRSKPADHAFQTAIALILVLEGARIANWLDWIACPPAAFETLFWIVIMLLCLTWALTRIDFGDRT